MTSITESSSRFEIVDERVEDSEPMPGYAVTVYLCYRHQQGRPVINVKEGKRHLRREEIDPERSILTQHMDPDQYPEITYLGDKYARILIDREWSFGRYTPPRLWQRPDLRNDALGESFDNLGLVLSRLRRDPEVKHLLLSHLQDPVPWYR